MEYTSSKIYIVVHIKNLCRITFDPFSLSTVSPHQYAQSLNSSRGSSVSPNSSGGLASFGAAPVPTIHADLFEYLDVTQLPISMADQTRLRVLVLLVHQSAAVLLDRARLGGGGGTGALQSRVSAARRTAMTNIVQRLSLKEVRMSVIVVSIQLLEGFVYAHLFSSFNYLAMYIVRFRLQTVSFVCMRYIYYATTIYYLRSFQVAEPGLMVARLGLRGTTVSFLTSVMKMADVNFDASTLAVWLIQKFEPV